MVIPHRHDQTDPDHVPNQRRSPLTNKWQRDPG